MAFPFVAPEIVDIIKVGGGAVLGLVGKFIADRKKISDERAIVARGLVACTVPMLEGLNRAIRNLERASLGDAHTIASLLQMEQVLLESRDVDELTKRVRENSTLDQSSLGHWRAAEALMVEAQTVYNNLRERSVLPGEGPRIATQIVSLQHLLLRARDSLTKALDDLNRFAAKDTKVLLGKHVSAR